MADHHFGHLWSSSEEQALTLSYGDTTALGGKAGHCVCVCQGRSLPLWCQDLQKDLGLSESSLVRWGREHRESPVVMWLDSLHVWYLSQRYSYFQHHSFIHLLYFTQMYIHTYIRLVCVHIHALTFMHIYITYTEYMYLCWELIHRLYKHTTELWPQAVTICIPKMHQKWF